MPKEVISPEEAARAQEFPDRVGFKPDNPFLASFRPYIDARTVIPEFTARALILGTLLGIIFGASSLYLVLKVGLTVSASIPVAVISISIFALLSRLKIRNATILENNIVQTAGSAGESIAFGVGVTMPAIMILGFDLELTRVMLVAVLGGLLGILMMIPLRRALIVAQHGYLKYPEGTACAEVLKAGASEESRAAASAEAKAEMQARDAGGAHIGAKTIFTGFGIGVLYQAAHRAFYTWKEAPEKIFGAPFNKGSLSVEVNPALLGVGYVIGPRIASIMCAGGVLAYLVLIPAIAYFAGGETTGAVAPGTSPVRGMSPGAIRNNYILYIGAGAVAAGGIISLFRSLPTIWHGMKGGLADLRGGKAAAARAERTDQDIPMKFVLAGIIALIAMIMLFPQLGLQQNILIGVSRRDHDRRFWISVRHRLFTTDRRNRFIVESHFRHDRRDVAADVFDLSADGLDWTAVLRHRAFHRRDRLYRRLEWRHDVSGFEDWFPRRRYAEVSAVRDSRRRARVGPDFGPNSDRPERPRHGLRSPHYVCQS